MQCRTTLVGHRINVGRLCYPLVGGRHEEEIDEEGKIEKEEWNQKRKELRT